jgi:hypothetical protein
VARQDLAPGNDDESREVGARDRRPFLLRLSPELLAELRAWANRDLRSLNAHIEFLLREALRRHRDSSHT